MNTEATKKERSEHQIVMRGRANAEVSGVTDVISFDEQAVLLDTVCGRLCVEGNALHVQELNIEEGIVGMDGTVQSITYFDADPQEKKGKGGFFGKLLR